MEELIKKCKCGVYLNVNEHKDYYQSVEDRILELRKQGRIDNDDIDLELEKKMIEADSIVELQFYPITPIGFYTLWGTSLEEVVKRALDILEEDNNE